MFLARSRTAVLANDQGGIYQFDMSQPASAVNVVEPSSSTEDRFWRVVAGSHPQGCLLTSNKIVKEYDFRVGLGGSSLRATILNLTTNRQDPENYSTLFELPGTEEHYTCLEGPICSLSDTRTLLLSRKNGLVTVHDVSLDELVHVDGHPYILTTGSNDTFFGHIITPKGNDEARLFRISGDGRLVRYELDWGSADGAATRSPADAPALDDLDLDLQADLGPVGGRAFSKVDLRPAYEYLFDDRFDRLGYGPRNDTDEVLDSLSTYWQRTEAPPEHILTTHDIVRSCSGEPENQSRADFLTDNSFISTNGYHEVLQNRLPLDSLTRNAQWHRDIGNTLLEIPSFSVNGIQGLADSLSTFDLSVTEDGDDHLHQKEVEAREELALDLVLSKDVFCHRPVSLVTSGLETMTGALSLSEEPPAVAFSFLQPSHKVDHYSREEGEKDTEVEMPPGVRLLLKEWTIGSDPDDAVFTDPYGDQDPPTIVRKNLAVSPPLDSTPSEAPAPAPPIVLASKIFAPPPIVSKPPQAPQTFSQPINNFEAQPESESQGLLTSTQVLPGPFGARPKKKPVKKRLGGF
ncbi:hypothetical protein PQX77_000750 [Marasmius sp. AFHP31]|nr:hypothetical protein PQX77_000750 [Marasmius sp. AFHP31]